MNETAEPLVDSFDALGLSERMLERLEDIGYAKPTPVQGSCVPLIFAGIDLIVQSQTGTGKTAAFAIPICDMLRDASEPVSCLILAPTRELAKQVSKEFEKLAPDLPATSVYGGVGFGPQLKALETARIVAATPGRLLDHLRSGNISLDDLQLFVLDEADEMLSMGFQEELDAIIEFLPKKRQCLLFSATVSEDIKSLASHFLSHPEYVTLSSDSVAARSVEHIYFSVSGANQLRDLETVIEAYDPESGLIFCNTRNDTVLVASHLERHGHKVDVINGDLPQNEREKALLKVKEGQIRFLVATDVAARGIDISGLPFVINYMMPAGAESYIHRTGRTGRAGKSGTALSLMTPREIGTYYQLIKVYHIDLVEKPLPTRTEIHALREARLLGSLVQQLSEDEMARRSSPYEGLATQLLERDDAETIVAKLLACYRLGSRRVASHTASIERLQASARKHKAEVRALREKLAEAENAFEAVETDGDESSADDTEREGGRSSRNSVSEREDGESSRKGGRRRRRGKRDSKSRRDDDSAAEADEDASPPVMSGPRRGKRAAARQRASKKEESGGNKRSSSRRRNRRDDDDDEFARIKLSLGESSSNAKEVRELVCYMAGLFPEDLGNINRKNGHFVVAVRADYAHDVVEAIDGQRWEGETLRARPAH